MEFGGCLYLAFVRVENKNNSKQIGKRNHNQTEIPLGSAQAKMKRISSLNFLTYPSSPLCMLMYKDYILSNSLLTTNYIILCLCHC